MSKNSLLKGRCDYCGDGNDETPPRHTFDCDDPSKCFACGRKLNGKKFLVDTRDEQRVFVGPECFKKIKKAKNGYQPPDGGSRLWKIPEENL